MTEPTNQPDELNALKEVVSEFVRRLNVIEGEMDLLKESRKDLIADFKDKLDMKTLNSAIRAVKIRKKVKYQDTFDTFVDILEKTQTID